MTSPIAPKVSFGFVICTDAATWVTVISALPVAPPPVALIDAIPLATEVTSPVELTVATVALLEAQVKLLTHDNGVTPRRASAENWNVSPTKLNVRVAGPTETSVGSQEGCSALPPQLEITADAAARHTSCLTKGTSRGLGAARFLIVVTSRHASRIEPERQLGRTIVWRAQSKCNSKN